MTPVVTQIDGEDFDLVPVTIALNGTLSAAVTFDAGRIEAIELPTIDSAAISFQVSYDGTNFRDLYDSAGAEVTLGAASTGARICAAPQGLKDAGAVNVKVRSGTTGATVTQLAARSINLFVRAVR